MTGVIIISENKQAEEMLKAVQRLLGPPRGFKSLILKSGKSVESMNRSLSHALKAFDKMKGILLLVDIYGSTQSNICMKYVKKGSVELIAGFNLPLLIKLATLNKTTPFKTLLPFVESYGKGHLMYISGKKGAKKI